MAKAAAKKEEANLSDKTPDHVRKIYRHLRSGEAHIRPPAEKARHHPPIRDDGYSSSDTSADARPKYRRDKRGRRNKKIQCDLTDFYSMYEEDDMGRMPMWKSYLYHLQQQAPKPKKIICQRDVPNKPPFYGREFHGAMSREDADFLLTIGGEGSFLIRESQRAPGQYTLAIRFQDVTKNFKLYYDGQHYVGEKRFDNIQDLVADGLITFYLESKAADYIAALSKESNYAESPYVAYNTFKKRQLAHPNRRTRSRNAHGPRPQPGPSGATAAATASQGQGPGSRSESSGLESGRESGVSTSGSVGESSSPGPVAGAVGGGGAVAGGAGAGLGVGAIPKTSRANIPVSSQFVEKRRSQAEASGGLTAAATPVPQTDAKVPAQPRHSAASTTTGACATYQQVMVVSQAPIDAPTAVVPAPAPEPDADSALAAASQPYYQNSEQIALHQLQLQLQQQKTQLPPPPPPETLLSAQIPPPPDEPAPRPPSIYAPPPPSTVPAAIPVAPPTVPTTTAPQLATATDNGVSAVDGKVSHSTNTDGPPKPPLPTPVPEIRPKKPASATPPGTNATPPRTRDSAHRDRDSASRSPSPRSRVRDSRKQHGFKMFENLSTPPSSPPPHAQGGDIKLSSVSWCTDYLEVMGCEKPHNFKLHTFKGPHWCDYCANFLWGLIAQGVKCQDCGLNAHKKCSERVPNDCMPDMKYVKRVFGIDLTTLVKAQNTLIPPVVELCVKEIEGRGLDSEGLYRVAGFHDDVEAIKMSFDKDVDLTDISEEVYEDINTITSVLKLYFRLLPIPLVTFEIYFRVIDTVRREDINLDVKLEKLKHILAQLPPAHYHTLKYLMSHLQRVTELKSKNMMNAENLSIVFAPTVLRSPETDPLSSLTAVKYEREFIEILINHHMTLFE